MRGRKIYIGVGVFCWILLLILFNIPKAHGDSVNLQMPQAPQSYQSDRFRHGDMDCSNAIGASTNLEFGVLGLVDKAEYNVVVLPDPVGPTIAVFLPFSKHKDT